MFCVTHKFPIKVHFSYTRKQGNSSSCHENAWDWLLFSSLKYVVQLAERLKCALSLLFTEKQANYIMQNNF